MTLGYLARRLGVFLLVVWVTATINFVVPRLAPGDPVQAVLSRLEAQGSKVEDSAVMIEQYRKLFGLDDPLWVQYLRYLGNLFQLNLGYSLTYFPASVWDIIRNALPYTLGLLTITTLLSFGIGIIAGALLVWRATPRSARLFIPLLMILAPIPYYLLAMLLLFFFAFTLRLFPHSGTVSIGRIATGGLDLGYLLDIGYHSLLPALSIILASAGGWALGMRGMMVTVQGEDFLTLAEAKGLPQRSIFARYAVRNAMLPQFTALAITLGHVVSGAVLVEIIFGYPGLGYRLFQSITSADYTVMQGITFFLVLSVAVAILIIDLLYPKLDPRITYARR
jgi:peptide/nickel transport system permease protein